MVLVSTDRLISIGGADGKPGVVLCGWRSLLEEERIHTTNVHSEGSWGVICLRKRILVQLSNGVPGSLCLGNVSFPVENGYLRRLLRVLLTGGITSSEPSSPKIVSVRENHQASALRCVRLQDRWRRDNRLRLMR